MLLRGCGSTFSSITLHAPSDSLPEVESPRNPGGNPLLRSWQARICTGASMYMKGGLPKTISNIKTPRLQTSIAVVYPSEIGVADPNFESSSPLLYLVFKIT